MNEIIIRKKPEISGTLRRMKVGSEIMFSQKVAKTATVRTAVYRLNKVGFLFVSTEAGLPSGIKVTRIK